MKIVLYPQLKPFWSRFWQHESCLHPARGLDHDLDTPEEKLCLPTLLNKKSAVNCPNRISAPTTKGQLVAEWISFSHLFRAESGYQLQQGAHQKAELATQRNCWSKVYGCWWQDLSLSTWDMEDSGVPDETCIKSNIFAVITEQSEGEIFHESMYSTVCFDRKQRAALGGHIWLQNFHKWKNISHLQARKYLLHQRVK